MKKKLLALTLSLLLLCGASFPALANDSTVAMLGDEPLTQADLNSLEYRNITDETLTLGADINDSRAIQLDISTKSNSLDSFIVKSLL